MLLPFQLVSELINLCRLNPINIYYKKKTYSSFFEVEPHMD